MSSRRSLIAQKRDADRSAPNLAGKQTSLHPRALSRTQVPRRRRARRARLDLVDDLDPDRAGEQAGGLDHVHERHPDAAEPVGPLQTFELATT